MRTSTFDNLVTVVGRDAAIKLIDAFGGRSLYIAIHPASDGRIAAAIGLDAALSLARRFGGERLDIPLNPDFGRARQRIRDLNRAGLDVDAIQRELRVTRQYVMAVLREPHARV